VGRDPRLTKIAVFGLGEAGSEISRDLAAGGADVSGFDPADAPTPAGVSRVVVAADAVGSADLVLALTAAADAGVAARQAVEAIPSGAVYADFSSSTPRLKRELAEVVAEAELLFADVALMSTVPGKGVHTPMLVSGPGAAALVSALEPFGASIEVVGAEPGEAATRKLLRSVVVKGLAAVLIESMRGAHEAGLAVETWQNVMRQLADADEAFVRRMVEGAGPHARRRRDEMAAAVALLEELGVPSTMTRATVQSLDTVIAGGTPDLPA